MPEFWFEVETESEVVTSDGHTVIGRLNPGRRYRALDSDDHWVAIAGPDGERGFVPRGSARQLADPTGPPRQPQTANPPTSNVPSGKTASGDPAPPPIPPPRAAPNRTPAPPPSTPPPPSATTPPTSCWTGSATCCIIRIRTWSSGW